MALSQQQMTALSTPESLPLGKIICCIGQVYTCVQCIRAARGDSAKIVQCAQDFVAGVEQCLTG